MDLNQPLLWLGLMGGCVMLVRGARALRSGGKSWAIVGLVVLVVSAAAYFVDEERAGYAAFATWALLVLTPNLVARRLQRAIDRQEHERAARLAKLYARVHPSPATKLVALDREVTARFQRGDTAGAERLLDEAASLGDLAAKWARIERLRLAGRFRDLAATIEATIVDADLRATPSFVGVYLRALGESGRRVDMLHAWTRMSGFVEGDALARQRAVVWLVVLAFAGKRDEVVRLLAERLSDFTPALASFWLATAELAASPNELPLGTERALLELARGPDPLLAGAAARRLGERESFVAEPLGPAEEAACRAIARTLDHEARFGLSAPAGARPLAVVAMITLNVIGYALEWIAGDPTSDDTLRRLGALLSPAVIDGGEWWRLGSCLFLHYGAVHLVMNMLGLWVLGPFVEHALGRARWLFVYLGSGLTGSLVLTVAPRLHLAEPDLCVGASGCIMGLVGATMAIALRGMLREKAAIARRRFFGLAIVVVLQTTFDLSTPQVSFIAHASGLVAGFVLASLLTHFSTSTSAPR